MVSEPKILTGRNDTPRLLLKHSWILGAKKPYTFHLVDNASPNWVVRESEISRGNPLLTLPSTWFLNLNIPAHFAVANTCPTQHNEQSTLVPFTTWLSAISSQHLQYRDPPQRPGRLSRDVRRTQYCRPQSVTIKVSPRIVSTALRGNTIVPRRAWQCCCADYCLWLFG
jgi:hypothetical protein